MLCFFETCGRSLHACQYRFLFFFFSLLLVQASSVAALLDGGVSGTPLAAASILCVAQSPAVDVVAVGLR